MVKIINKKNITNSDSLNYRIKFNKKYSQYNFDSWIRKFYNFKKNKNILDIGCGDGKQIDFAIKMSNKNSKIVGLDLSTKSIKKISSKYKNIKYLNLINTDMDNIRKINKRLKNYQFDLIHSTYSIYYSNKPLKLITFLKSKLKKNSRLIITLPGETNTLKRILRIKEDRKLINKAKLEKFFIKNFDKVQINFLNNYLKIKKVEDVIKFYISSGIFDKNKINFLEKYVEKEIKKNGYIKINKSSIMLIGHI